MEDIFSVYVGDGTYVFCSVDVVSMFDNINMNHVVKILSMLDPRIPEGQIDMEELLNLVHLDFEFLNYFKYHDVSKNDTQYYRQVGGIPMGGNTSNAYADLYMRHYLIQCRKELELLDVKLVRKFVDDMLFFLPRCNVSKLVPTLRKVFGLDFTLSEAKDGILPFLDLKIHIEDNFLSTSWWVLSNVLYQI